MGLSNFDQHLWVSTHEVNPAEDIHLLILRPFEVHVCLPAAVGEMVRASTK